MTGTRCGLEPGKISEEHNSSSGHGITLMLALGVGFFSLMLKDFFVHRVRREKR